MFQSETLWAIVDKLLINKVSYNPTGTHKKSLSLKRKILILRIFQIFSFFLWKPYSILQK